MHSLLYRHSICNFLKSLPFPHFLHPTPSKTSISRKPHLSLAFQKNIKSYSKPKEMPRHSKKFSLNANEPTRICEEQNKQNN